jgi:hypothetical protein
MRVEQSLPKVRMRRQTDTGSVFEDSSNVKQNESLMRALPPLRACLAPWYGKVAAEST